MLEVVEKSGAQLGGHKRVIAKVTTREEGLKFLQSHVGERKVPWMSYEISEPSADEERLDLANLEAQEKALDLAERRMALEERQARLDLVKRMAAGSVKAPVNAEEMVKDFLAAGPPDKVGVVEGETPKTNEPK
jgi:hypothetical protein